MRPPEAGARVLRSRRDGSRREVLHANDPEQLEAFSGVCSRLGPEQHQALTGRWANHDVALELQPADLRVMQHLAGGAPRQCFLQLPQPTEFRWSCEG